MDIPTLPLGQAGFRFRLGSLTLFIDPYLSDSVEKAEGPDMRRMKPAPLDPAGIREADWVLVTHAHIDHCDPETLRPLALASPGCRFLAPYEARDRMLGWGLAAERVRKAREEWLALGPEARVHAVPAAHPRVERDAQGDPRCVGYVVEFRGRRFYHAGDTSPSEETLQALKPLGPIDTVFLPVNEANFFRSRRNIVGNMSVREAFGVAQELGARVLVPMHWDMFAPNSVYPEEVELLRERLKPPFDVRWGPESV